MGEGMVEKREGGEKKVENRLEQAVSQRSPHKYFSTYFFKPSHFQTRPL